MRTAKSVVLVIALLFAACAANPTPETDPTRNLSAQGKAAYQATRVVKALDLFRDIAIAAEAQTPKLISTANTRKVIDYHESVVRTIGAIPSGWVSVAQEGLTQLEKSVPPDEWKQISPYARLLVVLYTEVQR